MMIISPHYAKHLIHAGLATPTTTVNNGMGRTLQAIDRHDLNRVDHYFLPIDDKRDHA